MSNSSIFEPIKKFVKSGSFGGVLLLSCVVISLLLANSALGPAFERLLNTELGFNTASVHLRYSIVLWINDGLMAIFFLMVGLEIKRELVEGQLASPKRAILPVMAALGGVAIPALIYILFNSGEETAVGWGIPMATDIAFALAIVTMLGKRVPVSLKVFLAALAIVDDLIAILVIAIFYNSNIAVMNLAIAGALVIMLVLFNRFGVRKLYMYIIPGLFIWYFIHHSGIHATIAGVLVAMTIPTRAVAGESPLLKLEHMIANPVNYLIMPLFALVNTNIVIESGMVTELATPLGLGIICGLVIGKPLGIGLIAWLTVKSGLSVLPENAKWGQVIGVGMLAGIGFTMSIFIAILSFSGHQHVLAEAKFSILVASAISGILGSTVLMMISKKNT